MDIPLIEQIKIQAQVLVPLVRALQAELGEERVNALVRKSLGPLYRQFGDAWWQAQGASKFGEKLGKSFEAYAAGNALDYEVVKETDDTFELNARGVATPSSTRSSAHLSSGSCSHVVRTSRLQRGSAVRWSSPEPRQSCREPTTAIFATG